MENVNKINQEKKKNMEEKKPKKKKSKENKEKLKKDETWKKSNQDDFPLVHWLAYTAHKPKDCRLDKAQNEHPKPSPNITFHSNVASEENSGESSLVALMSQLAAASANESWLIRLSWLEWHILSYIACYSMSD